MNEPRRRPTDARAYPNVDPDSPIDPRIRRQVVAFLRDFLPPDAIATYRRMIRADPESWHRSPHFASGFALEHLFRGNGITEKALGVKSLEPHWPDLLREAVMQGPSS